MSYKVLQFWAKLDGNYRFTLKGDIFFEKLADVNFIYFIYSVKILQCLENNHESRPKDAWLHHFWTNWPMTFLGENPLLLFLSICCAPSY